MTTFDPLFTSDLAIDVRSEFVERIGFGLSAADATAHVLERYRDLLTDPDDGPVVFVCLAALQLENGALQAVIRDAAIDLIESREAQRAWKNDHAESQVARRSMLAKLAEELNSASVDD